MSSTPSEKLQEFFATSRPTFYRKGEIVLRAGDARGGAFFVKSGYIKDSTLSPDGREFTLFIFKPNDLFSYNWIYNEKPNEHSFRAMSECTVYEKSREGLLLFLDQHPDVQFMITQNLVTRMSGLMQRIEYMAFGSAFQKVGSMIYLLAERFGKKVEKGIAISIHLTQKDIGELLGISRETTNIEIKKLIDDKILHRSAGIYIITDSRKLEKALHIPS